MTEARIIRAILAVADIPQSEVAQSLGLRKQQVSKILLGQQRAPIGFESRVMAVVAGRLAEMREAA